MNALLLYQLYDKNITFELSETGNTFFNDHIHRTRQPSNIIATPHKKKMGRNATLL